MSKRTHFLSNTSKGCSWFSHFFFISCIWHLSVCSLSLSLVFLSVNWNQWNHKFLVVPVWLNGGSNFSTQKTILSSFTHLHVFLMTFFFPGSQKVKFCVAYNKSIWWTEAVKLDRTFCRVSIVLVCKCSEFIVECLCGLCKEKTQFNHWFNLLSDPPCVSVMADFTDTECWIVPNNVYVYQDGSLIITLN